MTTTTPLRGISEIRAFFRTNQTPIYFVSPTAFNLLGIDRWVRNLFYVNYFDSFEGTHPRVFVPQERPYREFESMEDICNELLANREVNEEIARHGPGGKAVFVMFDEETEALAAKAGLEVALPSAELRHRLDSKIVTTQLANDAGVPSAPKAASSPATPHAASTARAPQSIPAPVVVGSKAVSIASKSGLTGNTLATLFILLISYCTRYLPYGMRYSVTSMQQIANELEESALVNGASWWQTFRRVLLPLLMPGLIAGWIYILVVSFRELSSSILLYSPGNEVLSILIFEQFENGQFTVLSALGVVMVLTLIVLVTVAYKLGAKVGLKQD